jgi:starch phosphorylase
MLEPYVARLGLTFEQLMALGRRNPANVDEPFTLSYLAMRGSIATNAVSRLHADVSRRLFRELYPRWPEREVPVQPITNGVHVPTWDSPSFDAVWEQYCGKARWLGALDCVSDRISAATDDELWAARADSRHALVRLVRRRLSRQLAARGASSAATVDASRIFDGDMLTLGFARRFTAYKRPCLLLSDPTRLTRLLTNAQCPVQLVVAGKAHPNDETGKEMVARWVAFAQLPAVRAHVVFLEDYDLTLAEELVRGVDVWLNTPRRPWEACGTSGMKVVCNGGLNTSTLDGWWAEGFAPDLGWAIGDAPIRDDADVDRHEAERLYRLLEEEIVPLFYSRDARGLPSGWLARVRQSMARLTPQFSANRMLREYVEELYLPAAAMLRARVDNQSHEADALAEWERSLRLHWGAIAVGAIESQVSDGVLTMSVPVRLGAIDAGAIAVEVYADTVEDEPAMRIPLERAAPMAGVTNGAIYRAAISTSRPSWHFTARVIPRRDGVRIPMELPLIAWGQR